MIWNVAFGWLQMVLICLNPCLQWPFPRCLWCTGISKASLRKATGKFCSFKQSLVKETLVSLDDRIRIIEIGKCLIFIGFEAPSTWWRKSSAAHDCQVSTWWLRIFCTDIARLPSFWLQIMQLLRNQHQDLCEIKKCCVKELQPLQRVGSHRLHRKVDRAKYEGGTVQGNSDANMMYFAYSGIMQKYVCSYIQMSLLSIALLLGLCGHQASENGMCFFINTMSTLSHTA